MILHLELKIRISKLKETLKVPASRQHVTLTTSLRVHSALFCIPLRMGNLLPTKLCIALSDNLPIRKFFPMSHHRRYHPHHRPKHSGSPTCAKHSGSPTCGHSWVQHWFLPRVNLLPGKSIGPQGHAITTVAVVLIKGTAACKQKRYG